MLRVSQTNSRAAPAIFGDRIASMMLGSRIAATLLTVTVLMSASSAQSLGEVARQERARKQARPSAGRILTEDDLQKGEPLTKNPVSQPEPEASKPPESKPATTTKDEKPSPGELQAKIKAQKQKVRDLEAKIQELEKQLAKLDTVGTVTVYQNVTGQQGDAGVAVGLCGVSNAMHSNPYKEWCEQPAKMAADIEKSQAKLKEEQAVLERLQEEARRQGYGSAFYDPD
jgi:hypothetical protein